MSKRFVLALCVMALLAVLSCGLLFWQQGKVSQNKAYGFIDVKESTLAFEIPGRIISLKVDEGTKVETGQVLAVLDTTELKLQYKQAQAQCTVYQAELNKLKTGYRSELLEMAQGECERLQAARDLAQLSAARAEKLYKRRTISTQERDDARYNLRQTEGALRQAQAQLLQYQNGYEQSDIDAKQAQLTACLAGLALLSYKINKQSVLKAPITGIVRSRLQELGNMVTAQSPVYYLAHAERKIARFYLNELRLASIGVGSRITVSAATGARTQAVVTAVSESAEFTPKTVQTEELRPDLMYEVRADFSDPDGDFRLGQAITVYFDEADAAF